jgi:hypothetical protein
MTVNPFQLPGGEALRYQTAGLLQHAYRWVRAASEVTPAVSRVAPALTVAAQLYGAGQYPAALRQLSGVVAMLHQARQAYPALPPL